MSGPARRMLATVAAALVVAAALAWAFWPEPVPVDLAVAARAPMQVTVDEEGETRVQDIYVVSVPLTGWLRRVQVKAGDAVDGGKTVIATMQETEPSFLDVRSRRQGESRVRAAEAAYALAEAERKRALAELDYARSEWQRAQTLAERGNISTAARDRAELALRSQEAALATAEAAVNVRASEVETARAELIAPTVGGFGDEPEGVELGVAVRSPVSGRVLRVIKESAGVVQSGMPLVEVGDPANLEVVVDLLSEDAVKVGAGDPVLIEQWGGQGELAGRVRRVEPYGFTKVSALGIEEQRVNVVIDFTDAREKWQALGHGFRVEVRIVIWQADDVLQVPIGAMFRIGDAWAVFVDTGGRAARRTIEVGHLNDRTAEVLSGLDEGEAVVLHPSDRVAEGARILKRLVE
ncbi:MAG TPA: HlyD family efflux transporter periplasmic adaptor subunit [Alphaproteobacteria bacterium]